MLFIIQCLIGIFIIFVIGFFNNNNSTVNATIETLETRNESIQDSILNQSLEDLEDK